MLFGRRRTAALAAAGISIPAGRGRQLGAWFTVAGLVVLAIAVPARGLAAGRTGGRHGHPGDGRVEQHERHRRRADPVGRPPRPAAIDFVNAQPDNVDIGVVGFDQGAITTSLADADRAATVTAIKALRVSGGTSLGAAILASLTAITGKTGGDRPRTATVPELGYWGSATIVLFSDGEDQASRTRPTAAATAAQNAGIHIDTVGVGTAAGTNVKVGRLLRCTPRWTRTPDHDRPDHRRRLSPGVRRRPNSTASRPTINLRLTVADQDVPLAGRLHRRWPCCCWASAPSSTVVRTGRLV